MHKKKPYKHPVWIVLFITKFEKGTPRETRLYLLVTLLYFVSIIRHL